MRFLNLERPLHNSVYAYKTSQRLPDRSTGSLRLGLPGGKTVPSLRSESGPVPCGNPYRFSEARGLPFPAGLPGYFCRTRALCTFQHFATGSQEERLGVAFPLGPQRVWRSRLVKWLSRHKRPPPRQAGSPPFISRPLDKLDPPSPSRIVRKLKNLARLGAGRAAGRNCPAEAVLW